MTLPDNLSPENQQLSPQISQTLFSAWDKRAGLPAMDTLPPHTTMGDRVRGGIIGRTHRSLHLAFGLRKGIPPSAGAAAIRPVAHSPGIPRQAEYLF